MQSKPVLKHRLYSRDAVLRRLLGCRAFLGRLSFAWSVPEVDRVSFMKGTREGMYLMIFSFEFSVLTTFYTCQHTSVASPE